MDTELRRFILLTVVSILAGSACASTPRSSDERAESVEVTEANQRASDESEAETTLEELVRQDRREHERKEARQRMADQFESSQQETFEQMPWARVATEGLLEVNYPLRYSPAD